LVGLRGGPAQREHALAYLVLPLTAEDAGRAVRAGEGRTDAVAQLENQAFRALLADAGDPGQGRDVAAGDGAPYRIGLVHREHRLGEPRSDAARRLQQLEELLLVVVGEAVQRERVLPDHQARGQPRLDPRLEAGEGARRAQH
jgi:hypothetical protein